MAPLPTSQWPEFKDMATHTGENVQLTNVIWTADYPVKHQGFMLLRKEGKMGMGRQTVAFCHNYQLHHYPHLSTTPLSSFLLLELWFFPGFCPSSASQVPLLLPVVGCDEAYELVLDKQVWKDLWKGFFAFKKVVLGKRWTFFLLDITMTPGSTAATFVTPWEIYFWEQSGTCRIVEGRDGNILGS